MMTNTRFFRHEGDAHVFFNQLEKWGYTDILRYPSYHTADGEPTRWVVKWADKPE